MRWLTLVDGENLLWRCDSSIWLGSEAGQRTSPFSADAGVHPVAARRKDVIDTSLPHCKEHVKYYIQVFWRGSFCEAILAQIHANGFKI